MHRPAAFRLSCITRRISSRGDLYLLLQESRHLLEAVLSVQPRMVGSTGGRSSDDLVADLAADIQQALPALMSVEEACIPRDPFAPLPRCGCQLAGMRACVKKRSSCGCLAASPHLLEAGSRHAAAYPSKLQGCCILPPENCRVALHPWIQSNPPPLPCQPTSTTAGAAPGQWEGQPVLQDQEPTALPVLHCWRPRHVICLKHVAGQVNSLGVVLRQELDRFNQLLSTLQNTLTELQQAIKVGGG